MTPDKVGKERKERQIEQYNAYQAEHYYLAGPCYRSLVLLLTSQKKPTSQILITTLKSYITKAYDKIFIDIGHRAITSSNHVP